MTLDRRGSDPVLAQLSELAASIQHVRDGQHELRNSTNVLGLRTERIERDVTKLDQRVENALDDSTGSAMGRSLSALAHDNRRRITDLETKTDDHADFISSIRTGLAMLRLLAGTSLVASVAAVATMGKTLGWW